MKKIISILLICVLCLVAYILVMDNYSFNNWTSKNINDIKQESNELDDKIQEAREINLTTYPNSIARLENAGKELKNKKKEYELKTKAIENENVNLGVVETKQYKIERLWITMENYAKRKNLLLKLDVVDSGEGSNNLYDLDITLVGDYIDITDFIYSIENDDTLGFKIMDFKLEPNTVSTQKTQDTQNNENSETESADTANENPEAEEAAGETEEESNDVSTVDSGDGSSAKYTQYVDVEKLKATFNIESVGIEFD